MTNNIRNYRKNYKIGLNKITGMYSNALGIRNLMLKNIKKILQTLYNFVKKVDKKGLLPTYWGEELYHAFNNEHYLFPRNSVEYVPIRVLAKHNYESLDCQTEDCECKKSEISEPNMPNNNNEHIIVEENENKVNDEENGEDEEIKIELARPCDFSNGCPYEKTRLIETRKIHQIIKQISPDLTFLEIRKIMKKMEECSGIHNDNLYCIGQSDCTNRLELLRRMAPHTPRLRTLVTHVYRLRAVCIWLDLYDICLLEGNWPMFEKLLDSEFYNLKTSKLIERLQQRENQEHHSENNVVNKFVTLIKNFNKDMKKMKINSCDICKQREYDEFLKVWTDWEKEGNEIIKENYILPCKICNNCRGFLKKNKIPTLASINGLGVDEIPEVLEKLNIYEEILIQRAKCFINVIKLVPQIQRTKFR